MPFIEKSTFRPVWYLPNGHFETIYPSMYRKVQVLDYQRERFELADDDFLDLDWYKGGHRRLAILTHGLEGSSGRPYCTGMAKTLCEENWDVLAWNCRSCSGEMNRSVKLYSHADTADLSAVVHRAVATGDYDSVVLIGFSMGGAITMNYLGRRMDIPSVVKAAIGFSMPTCLTSSVKRLEERGNFIYKRKFLSQLSAKIKHKAAQFPAQLNADNLLKIKTWRDFDTFYSAPMNHFDSPDAFYHAASSLNVLEQIKIPFFICNALNDPLLTPACSPVHLAKAMPNFWLETPRRGGHVGFYPYQEEKAWAEIRAVEWLKEIMAF
jgi:uncharacterized protein